MSDKKLVYETKREISDRIESQVENFFKNGGDIQKIERGKSASEDLMKHLYKKSTSERCIRGKENDK